MFLSLRIKWSLTKRAHAAAIGVVIAVLCCVSSVSAQSMPGYKAPDKPKAAEVSASVKAAQGKAPLSKLYGHLKTDPSKVKRLAALDPREKLKEVQEKIVRIGVVRPLAVPLDPLTDSAIYSVAEGDVRVGAVVSEGALYTRVHFKGMSLPAGARVFVYSASNPDHYFGPYEGRGESEDGTFWTPPLPGDTVVVEYISPAGTKSDAPFKVFEVSHIYKDIFSTNDPAGTCNLDVTAQWLEVAKATAMLQFTTSGGEALCTGTLMNDADPSAAHHVLTANHCISTQSEAQSVQAYWNYNSGEVPPGGAANTTFGSTLLATGTASDFTLLRLTGILPAGLFFSGWDASHVSASTPVTGIHHPNGSHKRISFGATNSSCPAGLPGPCANFTGVTWSQGTTEGGSSGSGIWTGTPGDAKLVGTLTGGGASCSNLSASDYYGRFSVTYPNISAFLSGTSCVTSLTPSSQSFAAGGGSGSFTVNAPAGCNWSATSTTAFVTVTPPSSGTGSGTVNFSVAANSGVLRSGSIFVGSLSFTVTQDGSCVSTPINIGETKAGSLSASDCPYGDGRFLDSYSFNATAGQKISISMSSTAIDTYLYLLNPDGSQLAENDDIVLGSNTNSRIPLNGFLTLPTTGSYTILATSYDAGETGSYSLTLNGVVMRTLTVVSQSPSGVTIPASPSDNNGAAGGATQYTLTYDQGASVHLFAPGIAPGGNIFQKWLKDGVDTTQPQTALVIMDADHTMTAVYGPLPVHALTVASSNPDSGVNITVSPNDTGGLGNGTTQFTRNYTVNTTVNMTAPATAANGNIFLRWQRDGFDYSFFPSTFVEMDAPHTMTAVYAPPATFTLTVASSNPDSGANITVTPNDKNGLGDGTTQFTRSYTQNTTVTLTAPASANGNHFSMWFLNGATFSSAQTATVTMTGDATLTAVFVTPLKVLTETGTNDVAAVNSVTFLRGPFQILDPHNFSLDGYTRIILFIADLELTHRDPLPTVFVQGNIMLPVEATKPLIGVAGLTGTYVVVRLPDGLPTGALQLTVFFRGRGSNVTTLHIVP